MKKITSLLLAAIIMISTFSFSTTAFAEYISTVNTPATAYDISIGGQTSVTFTDNYSQYRNNDTKTWYSQNEAWIKFYVSTEDYYELEIVNPKVGNDGYSDVDADVYNAYNDYIFSTDFDNIGRTVKGAKKLAPGQYYVKLWCSLDDDETYTMQIKLSKHVHDYKITQYSSFASYDCRICDYYYSQDYVKKPSKVSISKLTGQKKALTVKWKRPSNATGYQIQVATDKKFKKNKKTLTVNKSSTVSKKVTKLKGKKKYYVRVRSYITVDGKKKYSTWSAVKSVKTK